MPLYYQIWRANLLPVCELFRLFRLLLYRSGWKMPPSKTMSCPQASCQKETFSVPVCLCPFCNPAADICRPRAPGPVIPGIFRAAEILPDASDAFPAAFCNGTDDKPLCLDLYLKFSVFPVILQQSYQRICLKTTFSGSRGVLFTESDLSLENQGNFSSYMTASP